MTVFVWDSFILVYRSQKLGQQFQCFITGDWVQWILCFWGTDLGCTRNSNPWPDPLTRHLDLQPLDILSSAILCTELIVNLLTPEWIFEKCGTFQPASTIRTCLKNSAPKGPFKCYVTQLGVSFPGKKRYVISVTRGWVGRVKFPGKKHYVTLEWPQSK